MLAYLARLRALIFIMVAATVLAGCAPTETRESLAKAEGLYTATVESAIELREAGYIDDELEADLTEYFIDANAALIRANEAVTDGRFDDADRWSRIALQLVREMMLILDEADDSG